MIKKTYRFQNGASDLYFNGRMTQLGSLVDRKTAVLITDEHVFTAHQSSFRNWNTIVLKPGEEFKVQPTVDAVIEQLISSGADRNTTLIGIGGGVITDLTGYIASVYMRGLKFGFVPSSLLAMVDAAIGGKNGIDVGVYKNMVGTIRQPAFILYDYSLLSTLPDAEWRNGFAEIIKHACISDARMFRELQQHTPEHFRKKKADCAALIKRNAELKLKVVMRDEWERGERKLLNFGHTLGHALENQYQLSHGQAISIGMTYAASVSEVMQDFRQSSKLVDLLHQYGLPAFARFDTSKVFDVLKMDKKKDRAAMNFIVLEKIGKASILRIPLKDLEKIIREVQ